MYGNYYTVSFSEKQEPGGGGEGGYMGFFEKYPNLYDYFMLETYHGLTTSKPLQLRCFQSG